MFWIAAAAKSAAKTAKETAKDTPQQIDFDFGMLLERIDSWVDGFIRLLPNIGVAIVVALLFYGLAILARRMVSGSASKRGRNNLGAVLGGLVYWIVLFTGFMMAATVVVPSLKPGDLIAGLGVSSVAIGFAFKDILQNWLAGLLILLRQPFEVGDQIKVEGDEGTVERIETRATIIKTFDGQRIVIPNSDIYSNAVLVRTAYEKRRSQYDVGIGYGDSIEEAHQVILEAIKDVKDVESDPAPQVLTWDLAASWVTLRVRWWTNSRRASIVQVRSDVLDAIKAALDEAHIDMPYNTEVHLFHNQTEETDGDRDAQREGWPAPKNGPSPKPLRRGQSNGRGESEAKSQESGMVDAQQNNSSTDMSNPKTQPWSSFNESNS